LWWNANTISHDFVHLPFFRSTTCNRLYSVCLSALLGFPQALFRRRHLAHHGLTRDSGWSGELLLEGAVVFGLWLFLLVWFPVFLWTAWFPGFVLGMGLCFVHSHYEHARGTLSHYSRLYNWFFFNDGYHVEHHLDPARHWRALPLAKAGVAASRWPAILRWLEIPRLELLEGVVLRSARLRRFMLRTHERALLELLPELSGVGTVRVIGGGMHPRTALLLRKLLPGAEITIVDASASNLATARRYLDSGVRLVNAKFEPGTLSPETDLVVIPLSLAGDRRLVYRYPPARRVLVHDWIWARRPGVVVSWWLLKKLVLVS
jgi:hypothetical protein